MLILINTLNNSINSITTTVKVFKNDSNLQNVNDGHTDTSINYERRKKETHGRMIDTSLTN
jgi:hypothetical protein